MLFPEQVPSYIEGKSRGESVGGYERDARRNTSQTAVPSVRAVPRFARGGSLAADPPENTSTPRPQGRDTRDADRKIVALPPIRSRRVGAFAVKVNQLFVPP